MICPSRAPRSTVRLLLSPQPTGISDLQGWCLGLLSIGLVVTVINLPIEGKADRLQSAAGSNKQTIGRIGTVLSTRSVREHAAGPSFLTTATHMNTARPPVIDGDTALVPLKGGDFAKIDSSDLSLIDGMSWSVNIRCGIKYATSAVKRNGTWATVQMHRLILDPPKPLVVDHINGDGLDNRRSNLRVASNSQNFANSKLSKSNTSGYKGVSWYKGINKWVAKIGCAPRRVYIGAFSDPRQAALAYDAAMVKRYGQFARTNKAMGLLGDE